MGWTRNVLRVDLSKGTCKSEALNMKWAQEYLGQRGLATKYFVEEVDPKVEPLSPANKLIMWARLVVAAALMDGTRQSTDRIALTLSFPSGSAFRNNCRRYLAATPSEIRNGGGAALVFSMLKAIIARRKA